MGAADEQPEPGEAELVRFRRYREARDAGLSHDEAWLFADSPEIDVGWLRRLVALGCPPEQLAGILL